MSALVVQLVEAVKDAINAASFSQPVQAERHYAPRFDLEDVADLKVTVVPQTVTQVWRDRATVQRDYSIGIAIQKQVAGVAECDGLALLAEEIADHFKANRTVGIGFVVNIEWTSVCIPEHLKDMGAFSAVLSLAVRT